MTQKPRDLSKPGYFYTRRGAQIQCFYCDTLLRNLLRWDNVIESRASIYGQCEFLKMYAEKDETFEYKLYNLFDRRFMYIIPTM